MGDSDAPDFTVSGEGDAFLFGDCRPVGKLIAVNASAAFDKTDNFLCIAFGLWNVVQCISCERFA